MNGGEAKTQYTKMLDAAVREIKQNEERRWEYMTIYANRADEREIGEYRKVVDQVRMNNGFLTDEQMIAFMRIRPQTLQNIRLVLQEHPDWDDDDVADEVLDLEEAAGY